MKLRLEILQAVRESLGLKFDDDSRDKEIGKMRPADILKRYADNEELTMENYHRIYQAAVDINLFFQSTNKPKTGSWVGPLETEDTKSGYGVYLVDKDGYTLVGDFPKKGDAVLASAAPDLFKVAVDVLPLIRARPEFNRMHKAILKARGK